MSVQTQPLPDELKSPRSKLVYLFLRTNEGGTPEELNEALDMPLITLLSVLKSLDKRGLVERDGNTYVAT